MLWYRPKAHSRNNGGPACAFGLLHNLHDLTRQRDYADLLDELRHLAAICR